MRRELMFALVPVLLSAGIAAAAGAKPEKKAPEGAAPPAIEAKATDILKASSARLAAAKTMSFTAMSIDESFDIGSDTRSAVDDSYQLPFTFTGSIDKLTYKLGPSQMVAADQKKMEEAVAKSRD